MIWFATILGFMACACPEHAGQIGSHPAPVSRGPGRMDSMSFSRNWCGIGPCQART